jgi:hypothetical protein
MQGFSRHRAGGASFYWVPTGGAPNPAAMLDIPANRAIESLRPFLRRISANFRMKASDDQRK